MKTEIDVVVPALKVNRVDAVGWCLTLTRKQVEDALEELNRPEPLKPGFKVRHVHLGNRFRFLVLDIPAATFDSTVVACLEKGNVFTYLTSNLKRIEE